MAEQPQKRAQAISSEVLLLCAALNEPEIVRGLDLTAEHFVDVRLGRLYGAICRALQRRRPTSVPLLAAAAGLADNDVLRLRSKWAQLGVSAKDAPTYAVTIWQTHLRREAFALAKHVLAAPEHVQGSELLAQIQSKLSAIDVGRQRWRWLPELVDGFELELEQAQESPAAIRRAWISTGFEKLDAKLCGGLRVGQMHILAGETSTGKSSLALALVANAAAQNVRCAVCSFEDDAEHVLERMVARQCDEALREVQHRTLNPYAVRGALSDLRKHPVAFWDQLPKTLDELHWELVRFFDRERIRLAVIDYLQIMRHIAHRERSDYERTNAIVDATFRIARDTGSAIILASQYNRDKLLSGSSEIAQKAYTVMELRHRNKRDAEGPIPIVELDVTKHKSGPKGVVQLHFDGPKAAFRDAPGEMLRRYYDVDRK